MEKQYLRIARSSKNTLLLYCNVSEVIDNTLTILENWDFLESLQYDKVVTVGPCNLEVDTKEGLCSNASWNKIGLDLKYSIFKSWDGYKESHDPIDNLLFPISGPSEYECECNLFKNIRRKELTIYFLNCLYEIKGMLQ